MLIIGIDPGISGAICFLKNGRIIDVIEMPSMAEGKKNKKQVNKEAKVPGAYFIFPIIQNVRKNKFIRRISF